MNRSERRYVLTDSGHRKQPDWVGELDQQKQEFMQRGGRIESVPIGMSGYQYALSNKDRAAFCAHSSPPRKVRVEAGDALADDSEL